MHFHDDISFNSSDKIIGKIKTLYLYDNYFPPDIASFVRYVEKQGRAKQAKDNIIRRRKDAVCVTGN